MLAIPMNCYGEVFNKTRSMPWVNGRITLMKGNIYVFVLGQHVTELLACRSMSHGAVDVFKDLGRITGSVA